MDSDDEENDMELQLAIQASQNEGTAMADFDDSDEEVAVRQAIKASLKEAKRSQKKLQKKSKKKTPTAKKKVVELDKDNDEDEDHLIDASLLEDSSDEEDPGEEYDEERNAANSVLHTAEQLSAQVLRTMKEWVHSGSEGADAAAGMIVDGALSLGAVGNTASSNDNAKHQWISQETMKQACSGVTLSNYQLIGVNWLALLHGMKCNIENNRSTNVNGVLADEMGLGKTVQTIAFLSWLKLQKQTKVVDADRDIDHSSANEPHRPHLIVVPVSVLPNWEREFQTFCPEMNVVK